MQKELECFGSVCADLSWLSGGWGMHLIFGGQAWLDRPFHLRSTKTSAVLASGLLRLHTSEAAMEPVSSPLLRPPQPGKVALRRWGDGSFAALLKLQQEHGWKSSGLCFFHWGDICWDSVACWNPVFSFDSLLSADLDMIRLC